MSSHLFITFYFIICFCKTKNYIFAQNTFFIKFEFKISNTEATYTIFSNVILGDFSFFYLQAKKKSTVN